MLTHRGLCLKCKPLEIGSILFVAPILFDSLPVLLLHIECFQKVGNGDFLGQVLAAFVELVGQTSRLGTRYTSRVVFRKQYGHRPFVPSRWGHSSGLAEIAQLSVNPCIQSIDRMIDKTTNRQFVAVLYGLNKSRLLTFIQ